MILFTVFFLLIIIEKSNGLTILTGNGGGSGGGEGGEGSSSSSPYIYQCPGDDDCQIMCYDEYNCSNSIVECPNIQNGTYQCGIVCNTTGACEDTVINGYNSLAVNISCTATYSCARLVINGPELIEGSAVRLIASQKLRAAENITINAQHTEQIFITCAASYSCYRAVVNGPIIPIPNSALMIRSSVEHGFRSAIINAPYVNYLAMACTSFLSCGDMFLNATNVADFSLYCGGGSDPCKSAQIHVENSNKSLIGCEGCNGMAIFGDYAKEVSLRCNYPANDGLALYCPKNTAHRCEIDCRTTKSYCRGIKVYREAPYNEGGIDFSCEDPQDCTSVPVYCGNYTDYCTTSVQRNNITCINTIGLCGFTPSPTPTPTKPTRRPTKLPTTLSPTPSIQTTGKSTTTTSTQTNSTDIMPQEKSNGTMQLGVYIAIAVGGTLGLLAIFLFLYRLEQNRKQAKAELDAITISMADRTSRPYQELR